MSALGADDIGRLVRIYSAQGTIRLGEGRIIAWTDQPTVVLLHADGTRSCHVASLPHTVMDGAS